jgi:hypothetical protein
MKKWLLLFGAMTVCFTGGAGWIFWDELGPCKPGVNARNFRQLQQGMSIAAVDAILGQEGKCQFAQTMYAFVIWEGEEGVLRMEFGCLGAEKGRYEGKNGEVLELGDRECPTWKDRLSQWDVLGWFLPAK